MLKLKKNRQRHSIGHQLVAMPGVLVNQSRNCFDYRQIAISVDLRHAQLRE
jgi:hypothetical protein